MCLGIPGKIERIFEQDGLRMGQVDFGGAERDVCLDYVPEAERGAWVIVHVGFAISLLDEEEAQATLELLRQMQEPEEERGPQG